MISFLRSWIANLIFIFATGVYSAIVVVGLVFTRNQKVADWVISSWSKWTCWLYNIHLEVRGLENIPKEGVLFVFNHSSLLDIPVLHTAVPIPCRFGAKIELYRIPIFGAAMRRAGALPIMRGERDKVLELYRQSVPRVHAGESFVLAAEGTRLPHPGVGEKFKTGPFLFAIEGQFPIVPVVLRGVAEILPKASLTPAARKWRSHARVQILPPVSTKGLTQEDRPTLQEKVRILMTKAYSEE